VSRPAAVSLREAFRFWLKLGFVNFGGPTGQIAIMHDELVVRRRWIDEDRFLHALSFCVLLPGPEAQQLAIYIGWLLNGAAGAIAAGALFVLPASFLLLGLSWTYAAHGDLTWVAGVFEGLSSAVVGVVAAATLTIGARALKSRPLMAVAIVTFIAIFIVGAPFPLVVIGAGAMGLAMANVRPSWFPSSPHENGGSALDVAPPPVTGSATRTLRVLAVGLIAWFGPLVVVAVLTGVQSVYAREGVFYSQVAVVTFGGAYAILAYVGREVVTRFGLGASDVVAGLGLAETTPGPLILVVEFLGFLAAYRDPGDLSPLVAGTIGAAVTVWATFAPSFLWIFLGAPYVERLRANPRLRAGLTAITAAVVGVIAALALTVAASVLFGQVTPVRLFFVTIPLPVWSTVDVLHALIAVAAFTAIRAFHVHVAWVVVAAAGLGLLLSAVR
jgi:chromate transporter